MREFLLIKFYKRFNISTSTDSLLSGCCSLSNLKFLLDRHFRFLSGFSKSPPGLMMATRGAFCISQFSHLFIPFKVVNFGLTVVELSLIEFVCFRRQEAKNNYNPRLMWFIHRSQVGIASEICQEKETSRFTTRKQPLHKRSKKLHCWMPVFWKAPLPSARLWGQQPAELKSEQEP